MNKHEIEAARQFAHIVAATLRAHPEVYAASAIDDVVAGTWQGGFSFTLRINLRQEWDNDDQP